jgi:uncharacterized protein (TIGR03437 family)
MAAALDRRLRMGALLMFRISLAGHRSAPLSAIVLFWAIAGAIQAQPFIAGRGIVNAASYAPPGVPGGSIAQGSLFTIFGANLGPATGVQVSAFPLQTSFQGVSVRIAQNSSGVDAIPVYVQANQLNVIMPSTAPLGRVSVKVTYNGAGSNPAPVTVTASSPGIFTIAGGAGPGVVQNFVSASSLPVNSTQATAIPGQTLILYGTGLGAGLNADNVAPQAGNLPVSVEVFVGGAAAQTTYAGRSPCCSGLDQIAFEVPLNATPGCWVPVQVRTAGLNMSNAATIAISTNGAPCSTQGNPLATQVVQGGTVGLISLERHNQQDGIDFTTVQTDTDDYASMVSGALPGGPFGFNQLGSLPPAGSCTFYAAAGQTVAPSYRPLLLSALSGGTLVPAAAGLSISNGTASATVGLLAGVNMAALAGTEDPSSTLFLDGSGFTVTGTASGTVGAFQAAVPPAIPLTWTNRAQITTVNRGQSLTLNWSGSGNGTVLIVGGN